MTSIESLYYAIGEMAYAIAKVDGPVQREERERFHKLVSEELQHGEYLFDISDIIFQILDKEKASAQMAYEFAMKQIRLNSHYVSPEIKDKFIRVMKKVAEAYAPISAEEQKMMDRFNAEIKSIKGDPVFFD
ncbi:MAG: TerB family tellurite resistance protein [Bacteroidetes bacterium]|nr:TerB family tellurite resistance protein [Bacteroidota bacterium]